MFSQVYSVLTLVIAQVSLPHCSSGDHGKGELHAHDSTLLVPVELGHTTTTPLLFSTLGESSYDPSVCCTEAY